MRSNLFFSRYWSLLLAVMASVVQVYGQTEAPAWWYQRGVLSTNPANDYAALNVGQLKNLAYAAWQEMNVALTNGAGFTPTFTNADNNYAAVTIGQLKEVARPFYTRLDLDGYAPLLPSTANNDFALANIGQAKQLFRFVPSFDCDADGVSNHVEVVYGSDPFSADSDGDGVNDGLDGFPLDSAAWLDTDGDGMPDELHGVSITGLTEDDDDDNDGMPDWWEIGWGLDPKNSELRDTDCDGLYDYEEFTLGTNPLNSDTDCDEIFDYWEVYYGLNPLDPSDANGDMDGDGLCNVLEMKLWTDLRNSDTDTDGLGDGYEVYNYRTNPLTPDSDYDGLSDGFEVENHFDPSCADMDGDGLTDRAELLIYGTSPTNSDSDGDSLPDSWEIRYQFNPLSSGDRNVDVDNDGLSNWEEFMWDTDPRNPDSDGDGLLDNEYYVYGTLPLMSDTDGDGMSDKFEVDYQLNPLFPDDAWDDSDNDGLYNYEEYCLGTNPRKTDTDGDGLNDDDEVYIFQTNPLITDSDHDGLSDSAFLTNNTYCLGDATSGWLTITSRLDSASDEAAFLCVTLAGFSSVYVPVLSGTGHVTRIGIPLNQTVSFTLVASASGRCCSTNGASVLNGIPVLSIGSDRPALLYDPYNLFGSTVHAMALARNSSSSRVGLEASVTIPFYTVEPRSVCLHDPNLSFLTISSPDNALMMLTPSGARVYDMAVEWDPDWGKLRVGANYRTMDVALSCIDPLVRVVGSHKTRVHACRKPDPDPPGGSDDDDGDDGGSGPGCDCCNQCPDCEHHGDHGVPPPEDPDHPGERTPPVHVENRVFILGSAAENFYYEVDPQPTSGICPYCGHAQDPAGATDYATVTYCSGDLAAYPHVLRRSGEITVCGDSPSTNLWSSVLTIFHGEAYDQRRYTVLGTYPCERGKAKPATETWNIPCGVTNAFDLHTDVLLREGDVTVSLQGSGALFALNRQTWTLDLLCTTNGTYTADVSLWRDTYCDNYRQAQAFLLCESPGPGVITHGYSHPQEADVTCGRNLAFRAHTALVPDYDMSGEIDDTDGALRARQRPFRIWRNNNGDLGLTSESQNNVPNCDDDYVGGVMDLPDFLPLHLGLSGLIRAFGAGPEITYRFSELSGNLNIICTALDKGDAGKYLAESCNAAGENAGLPLVSATVSNIGGYTIPESVIQSVKSDFRKGVVIAEGYQNGSQPLVLEVVSNGVVVCSVQIPLCVSDITAMYRTVDLRYGPAAFPSEPLNYPDAETDGKTVIFLHGFSVSSADATVWFNEMFKRLYRSGSRARFVGVKWKGDEGAIDGLHYHQDVVNAFNTASNLAVLVNSIPGEKIIMAHSLGNMVVASAIADHGMQVDKYFMFNAAIPAEAFDAAQWNSDDSGLNPMMYNEWAGYAGRTWSACWHELFLNNPGDNRSVLTWKKRFLLVPAQTELYNYYSNGDETLETNNVAPSLTTGVGGLFHLFPTVERYSWHKQEVFKGRDQIIGTTWAGWGFLRTAPESTYGQMLIYPDMATANSADPAQLAEQPVFRWNPPDMMTNSIPPSMRNEILAKGMPALSGATGSISVRGPFENSNMNSESYRNSWPRPASEEPYGQRWKHSDLKNVAYFFNYKLFNDITLKGNLK